MTPEQIPIAVKASATGVVSGVIFLGIPQAMLVAAVLGALLCHVYTPSASPRKIPALIMTVLVLAFAGAWLAVALPHVPHMEWSGAIAPEALAGLLSMIMQFIIRVGGQTVEKIAARKADSL